MLITVSGGQIDWYEGVEPDVELRLFNAKSFGTPDGELVAHSSPTSGDFYKQVPCTIDAVNAVINFDTFKVASTTDGGPNTSFYTLWLFKTDGTPIVCLFKKLLVPYDPTETTLGDLAIYSSAHECQLPDTYLTADEILGLIANMYNSKETDVVYGVGRLSYKAAIISDPINVGDNDPLIRSLRDKRYLEEWVDNDTSLVDAIAEIGDDETTLVVSSPSQYVHEGAVLTSGTLEMDELYEIIDYRGEILRMTYLEKDRYWDEHGTGFTANTILPVIGGTGTGATLEVGDSLGTDGVLFGYAMDETGTGYKVGDRVHVESTGVVITEAGTGAANGVYSARTPIAGKRAYNKTDAATSPTDNSIHWVGGSSYIANVTGCGNALMQGDFLLAGLANGKYRFANSNGNIEWNGTQWVIQSNLPQVQYASLDNTEFPWQATTWILVNGTAPLPIVTDATNYWLITGAGGVQYYRAAENVATPDLVTNWVRLNGALPLPVVSAGNPALFEIEKVWSDDFDNCGTVVFDANPYLVPGTAEGTIFKATNTVPSVWTHGTKLRKFLTIPENITIKFEGNGSFEVQGDGAGIYVLSMEAPTGHQRRFVSDGLGKVVVNPPGTETLNLSWWAGPCTYEHVDNTHSFKSMLGSLGIGKKGGVARIPGGQWYTDPVEIQNISIIEGVGQHIDGINVGTCIYPFTDDLTYKGIFTAQQQFDGIQIRNLALMASASNISPIAGSGISAFRFRSQGPTSFGLTFREVTFFSNSADPSPSALVSIDGSPRWDEIVNVVFDRCNVTASAFSRGLFWRSSNSVVLFLNPSFRVNEGGSCVDAPVCGWFVFEDPDWRGQAGYDIQESLNRVIAGDPAPPSVPPYGVTAVAGSDIIHCTENYLATGAHFTQEDVGRYITVPGAFPSNGTFLTGATKSPKFYIGAVNSSLEAIVRGGPNNDGKALANASFASATIEDLGEWVGPVADVALDIGLHISVSIHNGADEGFNYFIKDYSVLYNNSINLYGTSIQGKILFNGGSSNMTLNGCYMWSNTMQSTTGDAQVQSIGGTVAMGFIRHDVQRYPYPHIMSAVRGNAWHNNGPSEVSYLFDTSHKECEPTDPQRDVFKVSTPARFEDKEGFLGSAANIPVVQIGSSKLGDGVRKILLQLSQNHYDGFVARWAYNFLRDNSTGYLEIEPTQSDRFFTGFKTWCKIISKQDIWIDSKSKDFSFGYVEGTVVTQLTDKTTAVETHTKCGYIITSPVGAVPANGAVKFRVDCSACGEADFPQVCLAFNSGSRIMVDVVDVADETFFIRLINPTTVAETGQYTIRYALGMRVIAYGSEDLPIRPPIP